MIDVEEEAHAVVPLPLTSPATGAPLVFTDLSEVRLVLRNVLTGAIVNNRDGTVTPAANVAAGTGNVPTWTAQPADNVVVDRELGYELHELLVEYVAGGKVGRYVNHVRVHNLGLATIEPDPPPGGGGGEGGTWSFYVPLTGARPGRVFTLPVVPSGVIIVHRGRELEPNATPDLGQFSLTSQTVTLGFDVEAEDSLWAHVYVV